MLLGFLIRSALLAAAVSTIAIVIRGIITREKIQQELRNRGVEEVIIDKIDNCSRCSDRTRCHAFCEIPYKQSKKYDGKEKRKKSCCNGT